MGINNLPLLGCLAAQTGDLVQDSNLLYATNLAMGHLPLTIEDDQSRDASYAKEARDLAPHPRGDIQPYQRSLAESAFDPVDDGLGQKARRSSIAVEDDHGGASSVQMGQKLLNRRDLGWARSQEQVGQEKPDGNERARPILVPEARQSAH